jgi:hypothetical protein
MRLSKKRSDFLDARPLQSGNQRVNEKAVELVPGMAVADGNRVRKIDLSKDAIKVFYSLIA